MATHAVNDERDAANSDETTQHADIGGRLTERNGGYARLRNGEWYEVANFQLEPIAYLRASDGWLGAVIVRTPDGERDFSRFVQPGDFNSPMGFKSTFAVGRTTIFRGNQRDVNALKVYVGTQTATVERDA